MKMKRILFSIVFWFLSLTWGVLMTLVGAFWALGVIIFRRDAKAHGNGCTVIITYGDYWGGVSLGAFTFCCKQSRRFKNDYVPRHEFGHSIQNIILGPLFIFLVGIPSFIRYHYIRYLQDIGSDKIPEYDSIWFEGTATKWGTNCIKFFDF